MNCKEAQELILETLTPNEHSVRCRDCTALLEEQLKVDAVLRRTLTAPELSPRFTSHLGKQIRMEPMNLWPEWLPDALHFGGCIAGTALCMLLLPLPASIVLTAGAAVAVAGYLAQMALREIIGW